MKLTSAKSSRIIQPLAVLMVLVVSMLFSFVGVATTQHYSQIVEVEITVPTIQKPTIVPIQVFPDFSSIQDIAAKKQMFLDFLEVYIEQQNIQILQRRERLLALSDIASEGTPLSEGESLELQAMTLHYGLTFDGLRETEVIYELLKRVDVIPVSLALAQAATESAWGTSRFALEANNLFGQYCYEEGCGLVPESRAKHAGHELRSFASIESSVSGYFMNLNTHAQYEAFRHMRYQMRNQRGDIDPLVLAYGLSGYSVRGDHYVEQIQTIIQQNDLLDKDCG